MSRYRKLMSEALGRVRGINEFKKMTVTFNNMKDMAKASTDLAKQGFTINAKGTVMKVDGKGDDLNKYAIDLKNFYGAKVVAEDKDHEISMARSELEAISDKALKLSSMLQGKSDNDNLEAWVQSKITKAKDYINSVSDYMTFTPDNAMEKFDLKQYKRNEDENEHSLNTLELVKMFGNSAEKKQMQGIYNAHMKRGHIIPSDLAARDKLNKKYFSKLKEELTEMDDYGLKGRITDQQLANLKKVWAKKTMKDVTPAIRKMLKDMDSPTRAAVANAGINVISKIVPEEVELEEFNDAQVAMLKKSYADMKGKRISLANADKLRGIFNKFDKNASALEKLVKADIPFVSDMAISRLISKHGYKADKLKQLRAGYNEDFDFNLDNFIEEEDKKEVKSNEKDRLEKEIEKKDDQINILKTKAEKDKAIAQRRETEKLVNPETGEPLLQVGIAYKHMRDKMKKEETNLDEMAKDKAYAIGMATAKKKFNDEPPLDKKTIKKGHEIGDKLSKMKNEEHPGKTVYEQIQGLKNKAEKSGMPYSILKKVYDRGMAAWRGGHRPGASQQQWAFARVNSFVTKSSGTWGGADKDLAKQVKGSK